MLSTLQSVVKFRMCKEQKNNRKLERMKAIQITESITEKETAIEWRERKIAWKKEKGRKWNLPTVRLCRRWEVATFVRQNKDPVLHATGHDHPANVTCSLSWGPGSSVNIISRLRNGRTRNRSSIPGEWKKKTFLFAIGCRHVLEPTEPFIQRSLWVLPTR